MSHRIFWMQFKKLIPPDSMKRFFLLIFTFLNISFVRTQEFDCSCTINTPMLTQTDPKIFEDMKNQIIEFMNGQKWTEHRYEPEEKIKCNIQITINNEGDDRVYSGELAIRSFRPVFGSTYLTTLLAHNDRDIRIAFEEHQPIIFSEDTYVDNLSSLLSFYAYIMLGLDYDSFSPFGGEEYFIKAKNIIDLIPRGTAQRFKGWTESESPNNRYWIAESMLSPKTRPLRKKWYDYHRLGLDIMHQNPEEGRAVIHQALKILPKIFQTNPRSMAIFLFNATKAEEIIEIYKNGTPDEKRSVFQVMAEVDAANISKYNAIRR